MSDYDELPNDDDELDIDLSFLESLLGSMDDEPIRPDYTREQHEEHLACYARDCGKVTAMLAMEHIMTGSIDPDHASTTMAMISDWVSLSIYLDHIKLDSDSIEQAITEAFPLFNLPGATLMIASVVMEGYHDWFAWYEHHIWIDD